MRIIAPRNLGVGVTQERDDVGLIGVPNENLQYPLEKALTCTAFGKWMQDNRIEMYGWINPSLNLSTSADTNYPLSYATRPNRVEFDQFLFRVQRVVDTVQTDHVDWGFHFDNLFGYDYHLRYVDAAFRRIGLDS